MQSVCFSNKNKIIYCRKKGSSHHSRTLIRKPGRKKLMASHFSEVKTFEWKNTSARSDRTHTSVCNCRIHGNANAAGSPCDYSPWCETHLNRTGQILAPHLRGAISTSLAHAMQPKSYAFSSDNWTRLCFTAELGLGSSACPKQHDWRIVPQHCTRTIYLFSQSTVPAKVPCTAVNQLLD